MRSGETRGMSKADVLRENNTAIGPFLLQLQRIIKLLAGKGHPQSMSRSIAKCRFKGCARASGFPWLSPIGIWQSAIGTRLRPKSTPVFPGNNERLHHVGINKIAVELIQLAEPEVEA